MRSHAPRLPHAGINVGAARAAPTLPLYDDPRDEIAPAIDLAEAMGWQFVKLSLPTARAALDSLHVTIQRRPIYDAHQTARY